MTKRVLPSGAVALILTTLLLSASAHAASTSAIWRENQKPGTWGWRATAAASRRIQAYGSQISVVAGQTVDLHVSTVPSAPYRIQVFRLGWYGGAGARLVECLPRCAATGRSARSRRRLPVRHGHPRHVPAADPVTGELALSWPVTDRIHTKHSWVTGEYLAQIVLAGSGRAETVPFVVRPLHPDPHGILVEVPVDTWQAYNNWGGKSLYAFNSSGKKPAVKVSFDRPFAYGDENLTFPVDFEYRYVQFLERSGFPLDYATDVDVDENPQLLLGQRLSMTIGHGEYWSPGIRAAWDAARDSGHDLVFLGANTGYWQIRYEDDHRTIVEYRDATVDPDPVAAEKTTEFRALDPPLPECELEGVQFQQGGLYPPLQGSLTVTTASNPWLAAAGLHPGDVLANAVRGEWDAVQSGCDVPAPTILLQYQGTYPSDVTLTTMGSGGRVLALGSEGFGTLVSGYEKRHCSVDTRAETFLRDALMDLGGVNDLPAMPAGCVKRPRHAASG
ncbi:MAG TPA: N,N-dimethylformamidase beta subunit family domain-containing protein [Solirubrobacteraceae bacterium]|jgi:hypothetical protein